MVDSKGDSLDFHDAVTLCGGTDVWYVEGCERCEGTTTLTLYRRGITLKAVDRAVTKSASLAGTIQITEVGNLTEEPKDKDLLEKLKRVYHEWVISYGEKSDVVYVESDRGGLTANLISKRDYITINLPNSVNPLDRNKLNIGSCGDCNLKYVHSVVQDSYKDIDKGVDCVVDFMEYLVEFLEESTAEKRNKNFKLFTEKFKL